MGQNPTKEATTKQPVEAHLEALPKEAVEMLAEGSVAALFV